MTQERGEMSAGEPAKGSKAGRFLGSLKDALVAASRDDTAQAVAAIASPPSIKPAAPVKVTEITDIEVVKVEPVESPSAEEAARLAKAQAPRIPAPKAAEPDQPPTTRVVRPAAPPAQKSSDAPPRTQLVRGRPEIARATFTQDPVVGFLVIVGGPGLGSFRPVFEGNNTIGRSKDNRIPLDFGDDTISSEAQGYLRYDSSDRSFLFVPNLAKTNVVSVNEKRPTGAVTLQAMDVITLGRTQVAFVPFCGAEFDWSEITEA